MLKERIFLTVIAIFGGVLFSVGLFYLYQKTKVIPSQPPQIQEAPSPPAQPSFFLNIDSPEDEQVFDKKIIPLAGKTTPRATVVVSLEDREIVLTPSTEGTFSLNITLLDGLNSLEIVAIDDGKTLKEKRSLTYTTESF